MGLKLGMATGLILIGITGVLKMNDFNLFSSIKVEAEAEIDYVALKSVNHLPIGWLDSATQNFISGWAYDEDAGIDPIDVHIYIDGKIVGSTTANLNRPDLVDAGVCLDPYHGFTFPTPTDLSVGSHTVKTYAINYPQGHNPQLIGSPKRIAIEGEIADIEFIKIASDNWRFETKDSKQPFVPFGCNYYDPETLYTEVEDPENVLAFGTIDKFNADNTDRHFAQLESIGVNTVKVFLSVISFEPEFKQLNEENFQKVDKIIELAKKHNIRIIFALVEFWEGQPCISSSSSLCIPWLSNDYFSDETSIEGLEFLVSAFGKRYADEPTIFAWVIGTEQHMKWASISYSLWENWVHNRYGAESALSSAWKDYPFAGENWNNLMRPENKNNLNNQRLFDYQLFRDDIAYNWIKKLSDAIRKEDQNHFITHGHMGRSAPIKSPREMAYHNTPYAYTFDTRTIAPLLDYVSIHGYANRIDDAHQQEPSIDDYIDGFSRYSYVNKPVILEEFVYSNSTIDKTLGSASGWLSWVCYGDGTEGWEHYFFNSNEQITDLGITFKNKVPSIKNQTLTRLSDKTVISLNMKELLTDMNKQGELYQELIQTYNAGNGPVGFVANYPAEAGCTDTDGGNNIYEKGTTCRPSTVTPGSLFCQTDECVSATSLKEFYCNGDTMVSQTIACANGCSNGACVEDSAVNHLPIGYLDSANQTQIFGWAYDENAGTNPTDVHIYIDGKYIGSAKADQSRLDLVDAGVCLDPYHGFTFPTPTDLSVGSHTVKTYAINYPQGQNPQLIGSPKRIAIERDLPISNNTLVKTENNPGIYQIINNKKHWIPSPAVFASYGFSIEDVIIVSETELNLYPLAKLIKNENDHKIYYLNQTSRGIFKRHLINPDVFLSYGNKWGDSIIVNDIETQFYGNINLIKTKDNPDIYLIQENNKMLIASPEIFNTKGFDWEKIVEVNDTEMNNYETKSLSKQEETIWINAESNVIGIGSEG